MRGSSVVDKIISRLMETAGERDCDDHFAIDKWEWPQGVALYVLYKRWIQEKDASARSFLVQWFERMIERGLPDKNVNTVAPFLTLSFLAEEEGRADWAKLCDQWAAWVMDQMPRTAEGGLQHITAIAVNEGELWADTLFMTVLFLANMGRLRTREAYGDEAEYQFLLHIKHLFDGKSGLWYHGWSFPRGDHFGGVKWARGNAWFSAGAPEFLNLNETSPAGRRLIVETLKTQLRSLLKLQDVKTGLWHTILDDECSYLETSASAAIAYGMSSALRCGLLDGENDLAVSVSTSIIAAVRGVLSRVSENGVVAGVSHGTAMGLDAAHYLAIPCVPTAYGQGLAALLLDEAARAGLLPGS